MPMLFTKIIEGMEPGEDAASYPENRRRKAGIRRFLPFISEETLCPVD
jgi:hypothetical protein